jgi:Glycosyl hydrolases family 16
MTTWQPQPPGRAPQANRDNLIFEDDFDEGTLDRERWFPYYLPHWSRLERTAARFGLANSALRLFIADDQAPWCPEFDDGVKVSNLQTGHFSGPMGGQIGQHRFRDGLTVRHALPELRLFLPRYCRLEMKARTRLNPWNLAALWLIGFEDAPDRSGEITVFEAFGHNVAEEGARIGRGIKRIHDPNLYDDLDEGFLPIDIEAWHTYAMDWTPSGVDFLVDGEVVTSTTQSPDYSMQLMLNFYDLPDDRPRTAARDAWLEVDFIRAYGMAA